MRGPGFAIELDLAGRCTLVVGLGSVGRRRAQALLAAGAEVIGVDPAPREVPEGITLKAEPYRPDHLADALLAFAAATPEVNRRVVADARAAGIWVNSATDPAAGDFHVPAVWREGGVVVTVATSGASPALAGALRDRAAGALGPAAAGLAEALGGLRPEVFARLPDPEMRRRLLADWGDPRWLELFAAGGAEAVRAEVWRRIDGAAPGRSHGLPEKTP